MKVRAASAPVPGCGGSGGSRRSEEHGAARLSQNEYLEDRSGAHRYRRMPPRRAAVMPPPGGTVIRVMDFPPWHPRPRRTSSAGDRDISRDVSRRTPRCRRCAGRHHATTTIDYAIILNGTMTAVLDDDETERNPDDIRIQRRKNHACENRTEEMVRVCIVLIDGTGATTP